MKDFERMVAEGLKNPMLMNRLSILSEMEPDFRVYFLTRLNSGGFERELRRELEVDPDLLNYTQEQRSELLMHWMNHADLASAEAFLLKHESVERSMAVVGRMPQVTGPVPGGGRTCA